MFRKGHFTRNYLCYFEMFPEKYLFVFRSDVKSADQMTEQHSISQANLMIRKAHKSYLKGI